MSHGYAEYKSVDAQRDKAVLERIALVDGLVHGRRRHAGAHRSPQQRQGLVVIRFVVELLTHTATRKVAVSHAGLSLIGLFDSSVFRNIADMRGQALTIFGIPSNRRFLHRVGNQREAKLFDPVSERSIPSRSEGLAGLVFPHLA